MAVGPAYVRSDRGANQGEHRPVRAPTPTENVGTVPASGEQELDRGDGLAFGTGSGEGPGSGAGYRCLRRCGRLGLRRRSAALSASSMYWALLPVPSPCEEQVVAAQSSKVGVAPAAVRCRRGHGRSGRPRRSGWRRRRWRLPSASGCRPSRLSSRRSAPAGRRSGAARCEVRVAAMVFSKEN